MIKNINIIYAGLYIYNSTKNNQFIRENNNGVIYINHTQNS
jgi:hypothetical protein